MRWNQSLPGIGMWVVAIATGTMLIGCGTGTVPASSFTSTGSSSSTGAGSSSGASGSGGAPSTGSGSPPTTTAPTDPTQTSSGGATTTTPPATGGTGTSTAPTTTVRTLSGRVLSGQNLPVSAADVYLFAAGSTGYSAGASSLFEPSGFVKTDSQGRFSGQYTCPSTTAQVYLIAASGDAGAGTNGTAVMMSALGSCGSSGTQPAVVNEITTVSSVYALASFMRPGSIGIGSSATNRVGIVNAFRTANNLFDGATGQTRSKTPAGNGIVPQTKINSLANLLAQCVESISGSVACANLFHAATTAGVTPRDTLTSVLNIALHPAIHLGSLSLSGPYQPSLASSPNDWTLSVEYTGAGLNYGQLIAADAQGDIWVPNAVNPGTLSEFGPAGEPLSGSAGFGGGGLSYPQAVAIDQAGNVWAANEGNDSVSEHSANGVAKSGSGFKAAGLKSPYALAIDGSGNVLTVNGDNTVTRLTSAGASAGQFQQGGLDFPYAIAMDRSSNAWIANYGYSDSVSRFSSTGAAAGSTGYTGAGVSGAVGVAIDGDGNAWLASFDQPVVSRFSSSGVAAGTGYRIPAGAASIAVDGDDTIWTANSDGSISRLTSQGVPLSPATGYISSGATAGVGITIDPSGNVWTSDNYVNSVFEYIGAGAPTTVPLQVALQKNLVGKRP